MTNPLRTYRERAVEHGSPRDFWVRRLTRLLDALELCSGQVRDAIRELE